MLTDRGAGMGGDVCVVSAAAGVGICTGFVLRAIQLLTCLPSHTFSSALQVPSQSCLGKFHTLLENLQCRPYLAIAQLRVELMLSPCFVRR